MKPVTRILEALPAAVVAAALLLLPPVAGARDGYWPGFRLSLQAQTGQPPAKKAPGGNFRRADNDKAREHGKRYQGRLTQEERRELHRDLDRANREIYRR